MNRQILLIIGTFLMFWTSCKTNLQDGESCQKQSTEINYYTSDSVQIFGDLYIKDRSAKTIVLFHQAGANARGEYEPIIPELSNLGLNILAVDQRTGGQIFGSCNRTMAQIPLNRYGYCDAYPEMEGALSYLGTNGFTEGKIVWGSSYSAALVIKLAAEHSDEVAGVLAFSPASGEPMEGCRPEQYFATLKVPLLVLRPENEMEYESVKLQFDSAKHTGHQTYVAVGGKHGSSMLVESRTGSSTEKTWKIVSEFLKSL